MTQQLEATGRSVVLVEDAAVRRVMGQLVLLGRGDELSVTDATPGTRYLLLAGQPYGEVPVFNGPYVD